MLSSSEDETIKVWRNNECMNTIRHNSLINTFCQIDNEHFASGSFDNMIKIWDKKIIKICQQFEGHKSNVNCLIKLNNNKLASCSNDKTIKIWE